jgi:hypothetical protein
MKASSPIDLPVRSCFLNNVISDSLASTDKNFLQDDFIIAGNGRAWTSISSFRFTCALALLQRQDSGFFTIPALAAIPPEN